MAGAAIFLHTTQLTITTSKEGRGWEWGGCRLAGSIGLGRSAPQLTERMLATDWPTQAPDWLILATDWQMLATDWQMLATDWQMLATDWLMLATDWQMLGTDWSSSCWQFFLPRTSQTLLLRKILSSCRQYFPLEGNHYSTLLYLSHYPPSITLAYPAIPHCCLPPSSSLWYLWWFGPCCCH